MEVKDVVFTGLGQAISDLDCPDGELSVSHNIIRDNGSMRPIWVPEADERLNLQSDESLVYIHRTDKYKNFIVRKKRIVKLANAVTMFYYIGKGVINIRVFCTYPPASDLTIHINLFDTQYNQEDSFDVLIKKGYIGERNQTKIGLFNYVDSSLDVSSDDMFLYRLFPVEDPELNGTVEWFDKVPESYSYGLFYFTENDSERKEVSINKEYKDKIGITGINNTLVVQSETGLEYILFKDNGYRYLGTKPPEPIIRFSLESKLISEKYTGKGFSLKDIAITESSDGNSYSVVEDRVDELTQIESSMTSKVVKSANDMNYILYPCFVRYAYRLYDGSHIMHSSPILLVPSTDIAPAFVFKETFDKSKTAACAVGSAISVAINPNGMEGYEDWSDIVTSIDFFMSEQINPRNHNSKIDTIELFETSEAGKSVTYGTFVDFLIGDVYGPKTFNEAVSKNYGSGLYTLSGRELKSDDYLKRIKETSIFYKVRSLDIDKVSAGTWYLFDNYDKNNIDGVSLSTLVFEERLVDDYQTHDILSANSLYVYNGRLNAAGVTRHLFGGYNTTSMLMNMFTSENVYGFYTVYTHLKKDNREIIVKNTCDGVYWFNPMYLYYPDPDVFKMTVIKDKNPIEGNYYNAYVFDLDNHPTLNGAVWFNSMMGIPKSAEKYIPAPSVTDNNVTVLNKIYTSEFNNPFYFPLDGINTVGVGEISGIASVTKALSQGQFGQFPLYVFSSDGVWAMEVGSNGLYTSVKPLSRDVCINRESITQTDNSVLFVTEKGVMMVDGSNIDTISGMMDGRSFDPSTLELLSEVFNKERIPESLYSKNDFMEYAKACRMAYDYGNSRIVLFSEGKDYCYVYSLTSGTWSTLGRSFDNVINAYPDVYVQNGSDVIELSGRIDYNNEELVRTLIVTRPLKFGDDGYKTVYEMICRGAMDRDSCSVLLWGSYDGIEYLLLADASGNRLYRSGGSGFRYYRVGVVGKMSVGETVSMCSLKFNRKYNNRLR